METSRLDRFSLACVALVLMGTGCRTSVVGHYGLDLDETKLAVAQSAAEHHEDAKNTQSALQILTTADIDVALDETGKMSTRSVLTLPGTGKSETKQAGTWKLTDKRLVITADESETVCDVDGKRLRCLNKALPNLFTRYVLIRK